MQDKLTTAIHKVIDCVFISMPPCKRERTDIVDKIKPHDQVIQIRSGGVIYSHQTKGQMTMVACLDSRFIQLPLHDTICGMCKGR